jgi:hypothetical protein
MAVRFWPVGLLAAVIGAVWLVSSLPIPWRNLAVTLIAVIGVAALWFSFGGRVVGFLVWLVPLSIATVALITRPSILTFGIQVAILVVPFLGWLFEPIGRAYSSVIVPIETWLLHHSLSRDDQRTRKRLLVAIRGNAEMREDSRQLEDLPRALAAMTRHADGILSVEAPDPGWQQAIEAAAAPRVLYRDMWAGKRPLDFDVAEEAVRKAERDLRDFLKSRSLGYRILSHQFVEVDDRRPAESVRSRR